MTDFDDRFADRIREVFDAYEEPVDEAALARMQAALGRPPVVPAEPPPVAPDRPPLAPRRRTRPWRAVGLAALGALVLALGAALWSTQTTPDLAPQVASGEPTPEASGERATPGERSDDTLAALDAEPTPPIASPARTAPPALETLQTAPRAPRRVPLSATRETPRPPTPRPDLAPEAPIAARDDSTEAPGDATTGVDVPRDGIAVVDPPAPEAAPTVDSGAPLAEGRSPIVQDEPLREPEIAMLPASPDPGQAPASGGLRLTVASVSGVSNGRLAGGAGVSAGVTRAFDVGRGLSVSTGGAIAYNRFVLGPGALTAADAFGVLDSDPSARVDVTQESEVETLAIEVPLDLRLGVASLGRGRVNVGVGVTSAVYVAQAFREEGQTFSNETVDDPGGDGGEITVVGSSSFSSNESVDPLGRIDLARQLNLSVGYGAGPLAVDVYARLPLRGVTSRDLPLTMLGVRLAIPLTR